MILWFCDSVPDLCTKRKVIFLLCWVYLAVLGSDSPAWSGAGQGCQNKTWNFMWYSLGFGWICGVFLSVWNTSCRISVQAHQLISFIHLLCDRCLQRSVFLQFPPFFPSNFPLPGWLEEKAPEPPGPTWGPAELCLRSPALSSASLKPCWASPHAFFLEHLLLLEVSYLKGHFEWWAEGAEKRGAGWRAGVSIFSSVWSSHL